MIGRIGPEGVPPGFWRLFAFSCGLAFVGCVQTDAHVEPVEIAVDHHVHLLSPRLVEDWRSLGVSFSRPDSAYFSASAALPNRSTNAFLVSMAHLYGSEEFREALELDLESERLRVRDENEYIAREAARGGGSLAGFCSVPLLRPYLHEELAHCREALGLPGIKIHLPAMEVSLADEAHVRLLAGVAERAARDSIAVLVHLSPVDGELSQDDLRVFFDRVVAPYPTLELYLAHLGGNGGYRASARRVVRELTAFLRAADDTGDRQIYLELSGALLTQPTDGVPASSRADARLLAHHLRTLGIERVLFGSDYPVFEAGGFAALLRDRLPLSQAEFTQLMTNLSPRFRAARDTDAPCSSELHRLPAPLVGSWHEFTVTPEGLVFEGELRSSLEAGGCAFSQTFVSADSTFTFRSLGYVSEVEERWIEHFVLSNGRTATYLWEPDGTDILLVRTEPDQGRFRLRVTEIQADSYRVIEERRAAGSPEWLPGERTLTRRVPGHR
jgi:uncharacterized protein